MLLSLAASAANCSSSSALLIWIGWFSEVVSAYTLPPANALSRNVSKIRSAAPALHKRLLLMPIFMLFPFFRQNSTNIFAKKTGHRIFCILFFCKTFFETDAP
jgi:hypothetical protein